MKRPPFNCIPQTLDLNACPESSKTYHVNAKIPYIQDENFETCRGSRHRFPHHILTEAAMATSVADADAGLRAVFEPWEICGIAMSKHQLMSKPSMRKRRQSTYAPASVTTWTTGTGRALASYWDIKEPHHHQPAQGEGYTTERGSEAVTCHWAGCRVGRNHSRHHSLLHCQLHSALLSCGPQ